MLETNLSLTTPDKLPGLKPEQLAGWYTFFSEVIPKLTGRPVWMADAARKRLDQLDNEISQRRKETSDDKTRLRADLAFIISLLSLVASTLLGVLGYLSNKPTPNPSRAATTETTATSSPSSPPSPSPTPEASGRP
jgi:hypothetical protein